MPIYATKMCCLLTFLPMAGMAQPVFAPPAATWSSGAGVGNGVELHVGYLKPHLMAWMRGRGKWWGPEKGPEADFFGSEINTKSRQFEVAALAGYPLAVGRSTTRPRVRPSLRAASWASTASPPAPVDW